MLVYPMAVSIGGENESFAELRINSKSEATQYVQVLAKRVIDPATDHEREEEGMHSGEDAIVISPARFALPAGGTRLLRVIPMGLPQSETVYRIYLQPTTALTDEDLDAGSSISGSVKFSIVWAPLVRVLPKAAMPNFDVLNGELINTGNIRIGLIDAGACRSEKEEKSCQLVSYERSVYPGQTLKLNGAQTAPYVRIRYKVEGEENVKNKVLQTYKIDSIDTKSVNQKPQMGTSDFSTNHKE